MSNPIALVPAYEAARSVGTVVRDLLAIWPGEEPRVLVIDDGSTDDTGAQATLAGARLLRHDRNRGKGAALQTGLREAHRLGARTVVTVDADGQHRADEALRLALHPAAPEALVLGIRDLERDGAPRANRISNGIANFFLSWFSGRLLRDTQCGLRRYPVAETLAIGARDAGYAFESEIVLRAARAGWDIVEEPVLVYYPPEEERLSHFHVVNDPAKIVRRVVLTLAETRAGAFRGERTV